MLELDDGRLLPESNAILWYLAEGMPLLADDAFVRAQTLRWMCFERYRHEPGLGGMSAAERSRTSRRFA